MSGSLHGRVKVWKSDKGYGFLKREDGRPDVFMHVRDLKSSGVMVEPKVGDELRFDIKEDPRPHAVNLAKA